MTTAESIMLAVVAVDLVLTLSLVGRVALWRDRYEDERSRRRFHAHWHTHWRNAAYELSGLESPAPEDES